jgi:hypothetical protein
MTLNIFETMTQISGPNPIEGQRLDEVFEEVRVEWIDALNNGDDTWVLSTIMREVGKRFPLDDPRNPDWRPPKFLL